VALLYAAETQGAAVLFEFLHRQDPSIEIRVWPDCGQDSEIEFVVVSGEAPTDLRRFVNLRGMQSTWAGVNALLNSRDLPPDVPLARMVADEMSNWMAEYVVYHVLDIIRGGSDLRSSQAECIWQQRTHLASKPAIGILGLGELGQDIARKLLGLNFDVSGWVRTKRQFEGISIYSGPGELPEFLGRNSIVVCLLPLTEHTRGILNAELFARMPRGSSIIHVGRGPQLMEGDLIKALDTGQLSRAVVDVFAQEPLPEHHPFWSHPKITVTPHVAAISRAGMGAALILENYHRAIAGRELLHQVDRTSGY